MDYSVYTWYIYNSLFLTICFQYEVSNSEDSEFINLLYNQRS